MTISRDISDQSPKDMSERNLDAFPHVIYEQYITSKLDEVGLAEALSIAQQAGLPFIADINVDAAVNTPQVSIRTSTADRFDLKTEGALFHGISSMMFTELETGASSTGSLTPDIQRAARDKTQAALLQITDNPQAQEMFGEYYSGLRWGTDQEKFIRAMIANSTQFDYNQALKLDPYAVLEVMDKFGIDVEYPQLGKMRDMKAKDLFERFPQIDPAQLGDPAFSDSDEGKMLGRLYAHEIGQKVAQRYEQSRKGYGDVPDEVPQLVPLAHFPLIEAIMVDEVSMNAPRASYDFGPREVVDLILASDSNVAQRSLVHSLTRRLPEGQRRVFDGPHELQQKRSVISSIRHAFERSDVDSQRYNELREQLLTVLEAYQADGSMAKEVRADHAIEVERGVSWHSDTSELKDIVKDIMISGLKSMHPEVFIRQYVAETEASVSLYENDPLALTKSDLAEVIVFALESLDSYGQPAVFESFGREVFGSEEIAQSLQRIASLRVRGREMFDQPAIHVARRALRRGSFGDDNDAREAYNLAVGPAEDVLRQAQLELHTLLLDYLADIADQNCLDGQHHDEARIFKEFVKHIRIKSGLDVDVLGVEYGRLMEIAAHANVPTDAQATILWHIAEQTKFSSEESSHLLVQTVLDGYKLLLGEPDNVRMPDHRTSHALSALSYIAQENNIFKYASTEQLDILGQYKQGFNALVERSLGASITDGADDFVNSGKVKTEEEKEFVWMLDSVAREIQSLEKMYEKYLYLEDVKEKPHVYYPWLLRKMAPFWHSMQREVGPGNRPTQPITALYEMLKDHVENKLVLSDEDKLVEGFDVMKDGNLGSLLFELYKRMIPRTDIQYNNTVWQQGMPFVHTAIAMMPKTSLEQMKAAYSHETNFISYIESVTKKDA